MVTYRIDRDEYMLRFDTRVMARAEEKYGGMRETFSALHGDKLTEPIKFLFVSMNEAAREYIRKYGTATEKAAIEMQEAATGDEIYYLTGKELADLVAIMEKEMVQSSTGKIKSEDDDADGIIEADDEENEKNGRAGNR